MLGAGTLALRQRTWSLDGCIHTLASVRPADTSASGHLLLRPVSWAWTRLLSTAGPLTLAQRYDALHLLFALFGIAALTLLFAIALRRSGPLPAWLALAAIAISRNAERQIVTFDEKPLGMFVFALAVLATDSLFRNLSARGVEPRFARSFPTAIAWLLAVLGHLENVPFAVAAAVALLAFFHGPGRIRRWALLVLRLGLSLALLALSVVAAGYARMGGLTALPGLARYLFVTRYAPPAPTGIVALLKATLIGIVKAFFFVDRLSPHWAIVAAPIGTLVIIVAIALGARRQRDPLGFMLAGGSLLLAVTVFAANFFPDFGDSYTMLTLASLVLLAAAPRGWLVAAAAGLWIVCLPGELTASWPETTMQSHLEDMLHVQVNAAAPWAMLDELTHSGREQGLVPVYYAMSESLRVERGSFAALPPGRFLLELPQVIEPDGSTRAGRVDEVRRELAARGRTSEHRQWWSGLRTVRTDFRRYGDYLVVDPSR